jgi:hypothetical protein
MEISRRVFAEQLALMAAAPYLVDEFPLARRERGSGGEDPQAPQEPSALAKALAESVRLRYPDRFSADDLTAITRSIDSRLRAIERLYQTALTNADEPDFVYSVYRGVD